jgi:hypothetical protein
MATFKIIAGHSFQETTHGRVCSACGKYYAEIGVVDIGDIGKTGIAHVGALTPREYDEIQRENDRIWALLVGVATGDGPDIHNDESR